MAACSGDTGVAADPAGTAAAGELVDASAAGGADMGAIGAVRGAAGAAGTDPPATPAAETPAAGTPAAAEPADAALPITGCAVVAAFKT